MSTRMIVLGAALACGACWSGSSRAPEPSSDVSYSTESCPVPAGTVGYPVTVVSADSTGVDSAWLEHWALAAAHRWVVPSKQRDWIMAWRNVTERIIPRHPRWADDWQPTARHHAELVVTLAPNGTAVGHALRVASGDGLFDRSLETILTDPMPASPEFPAPPPRAAGITLVLRFGGEPRADERAAVVRFARQQRRVRLVPNSLVVYGEPDDRATVKYDVSASGDVVPGTIEILEARNSVFTDALRYGLSQAHFFPAQSDCDPIPLTVVQQFGRY